MSTSSATTPRVSVIMANYNGADHVAAAVRSVLRQSEQALELVLADDGSTDDSVARAIAAAAGDPRLIVVHGGGRTGPAATRNRALSKARGAWLAVVDNDDYVHPDRMRRLLDAAEADGADIVADDLLTFYDDVEQPPHPHLRADFAEAPQWISAAQYQHHDRLFRGGYAFGYLKPAFRRALGVRYDESLRIGEDSELVLRLLIAGARLRTYPQLTYFYRKHRASISHRLDRAAIAALDAAHAKLDPGADTELAHEMADARGARADAAAFTDIVDALKARRIAAATTIALRRPASLALMRMPIAARLSPTPPRAPAKWEARILVLARSIGDTDAFAARLRLAGHEVQCLKALDVSRASALSIARRSGPGVSAVVCEPALEALAPYALAPDAPICVVVDWSAEASERVVAILGAPHPRP